jgi:hypothetical protein
VRVVMATLKADSEAYEQALHESEFAVVPEGRLCLIKRGARKTEARRRIGNGLAFGPHPAQHLVLDLEPDREEKNSSCRNNSSRTALGCGFSERLDELRGLNRQKTGGEFAWTGTSTDRAFGGQPIQAHQAHQPR